MKSQEKIEAIALRGKGATYREILKIVPVSKSTLSLWLRSVGLSKRQKQRITLKRIEAGRRGGAAQRMKRIKITQKIKGRAKAEIGKLSIGRKELWLMGSMLYWAEGTKEKSNSSPAALKFSNSDPLMIKLFIRWLIEICKVPKNRITYELYIHENNKHRIAEVKAYWANVLGVSDLPKIYFKRHNVKTRRKNIGSDYFGLIRVGVKESCFLNRKIAGWIEGINQHCGIV